MRALLLLALVPLLAACEDRAPTSTAFSRAANQASANTDTLVVDGQPQAITFREISGPSLPIPFTARIPDDMALVMADEAAGAVRITHGAAPNDALWSVVFLADSTEDAARAAARAAAEAKGTVADTTVGGAAAFATTGAGRTGMVRLGQHAGRYFYVLTDASENATDDVDARVQYLQGHWLWTDDGTSLGS